MALQVMALPVYPAVPYPRAKSDSRETKCLMHEGVDGHRRQDAAVANPALARGDDQLGGGADQSAPTPG